MIVLARRALALGLATASMLTLTITYGSAQTLNTVRSRGVLH